MEITTQNNILIAEFMGVRYANDNVYIDTLKEMQADGIYFEQGYMASELKYDTDWDWLMGVVDKIESLGYVHSIYGNFSTFLKKGTFNELIWVDEFRGNTKLEAVYISVIEFIKWYNEQNK